MNDFNEVRAFGARVSVNRTSDQTKIGNFWAYDDASKLGVPPHFCNLIVRVIALQQNNSLEDNARLFALVNYTMADASIAAWDSKYYYNIWRPILSIRQRTTSNVVDRNWRPLGAPTNGTGDNFAPEFSSYVSGHATFGSAVFYVLRRFHDTDYISFEFQSDEYNGKIVDSITRRARPVRIRRY
ncbi:unnamed protein product [Rotaria magnacalcarata]|nr:unnamed protein product [Rotaria magnacalcarata]CAF3883814.1 unnamed protein product [Rotaria magnacalcarata]CAF4088001.1 unnamed protein product [Rotaria magnacalcarata]